ncbi:dimethylargininase [Dethiosulfatibacter aminovorans DSM 17477]|uniref:Dimethylargininase n=1 Tax=Dethiosulfatibacter aminovorans DSM 17477 TaxID=1121476 RepID=A0A1M6JUC2_9FIRM|nr:arginine deiminase-related protein [Dethiosulfatibacter aminovorans]SHJ50212.1 dimethylargininase [Dethiosulfatibacter aminovorans DSM 17477]
MFKQIIVRTPARSVVDGITSQNLGKPDIELTLEQHEKYIETMRKTGVEVRILPADERFPDGNYVEDVAVLTDRCAIVTNPGAESRKDEIYGMVDILKDYFDDIEYIKAPGELEGGDIMRVGDHFYIGQSKRTNKEGADQFIAILEKYGYTGSTIPVTEVLHLKTGITYMEDGNMLAIGEHTRNREFTEKYNVVEIPVDESYAVNCIRMNDYVVMPEGFPRTRKILDDLGYEVLETPMSEFEKMDGGLTCLSLRFVPVK